MKLITFASFKGGAGKTTALMAACNAMSARGFRVGLFEADENRPLGKWREAARRKTIWDDTCRIEYAEDIAAFEAAYEIFETAGVDIALADTHGGGSDLNDTIIVSSDLVVLPMALTRLDLDATLDTYEYIAKLMEENERADVPVGILVTQVRTTGKLSASEAQCLRIVEDLPSFDFRLPLRNAFRDIASTGMLHIYRDALAAVPAKRIAATHISTAVRDCDTLSRALLETLEVDLALA